MAPALAAQISQHVINSITNSTENTTDPLLLRLKNGSLHTHRDDFLTNLQLIAFAVVFLIVVVLIVGFLGRMIMWNTEFAYTARMEAAEEGRRQAMVARQQPGVEEGLSLQGPWDDDALMELDEEVRMDVDSVMKTKEGRSRLPQISSSYTLIHELRNDPYLRLTHAHRATWAFFSSGLYNLALAQVVPPSPAQTVTTTVTASAGPLRTHIHINEVVDTVTEYVTCVLSAVTSTVPMASATASATERPATVPPGAEETDNRAYDMRNVLIILVVMFSVVGFALVVYQDIAAQRDLRQTMQEMEKKRSSAGEVESKLDKEKWLNVDREQKPVKTRSQRERSVGESDTEE